MQSAKETLIETVPPEVVLLYTRNWIHYGTIGFVVLVTAVAALRGLVGF